MAQEVTFEIVRQDPEEVFRDGQRSIDWHVYFRTPSGVTSSITIPDTHYSAHNVHRLIVHKVAEIEKTAALTGTPPHPPLVQVEPPPPAT